MTFLGEAHMSGLPPAMYAAGVVHGIPVVESNLLAYDEMFISALDSKIVVGELSHFRYRIEQIRLNEECRRLAGLAIVRAANEILGVPWKVGER